MHRLEAKGTGEGSGDGWRRGGWLDCWEKVVGMNGGEGCQRAEGKMAGLLREDNQRWTKTKDF